MKTRRSVLIAAAAALGGCALGPTPRPNMAVYDFGLDHGVPAPAPRIAGVLALDEVYAPGWINSAGIVYRLAYRDGARLQPYAHSRWAASPASLFGQRLRLALGAATERGVLAPADGGQADHLLRVELESFVQIIDAPDRARGLVRARATLIDTRDRALRAQRLFAAERPSPSVDAEGAVRALGAASDALIGELVEWVTTHAGQR